MRRKAIDWKQASVAATFYEPVYQRLRLWHDGEFVHLLCFVGQTTDRIQRLLTECGAGPSEKFRAPCFAEIWELSEQTLTAGVYGPLPAKLDRAISEALGCLNGNYSAKAGTLWWRDADEKPGLRQFPSRLLQQCQPKQGPRR
jgi:hypothetical protein